MNNEAKNQVIKSAENGVITTKKVSELGVHRSVLKELIDDGTIIKRSRGIYVMANEWEDEYLLLQHKYGRGIYSHGTALYLWGLSDRTPTTMHMTFPTNYNSESIKAENISVTRVLKENYELGVTTVKTPYGNTVKVYDIERSLCDMFRGTNDDIQTRHDAMKRYLASKDRDINRLMYYAKKLRVATKIRQYVEVLI